MSHKTRAEQRAFKVRKDPKKIARLTKIHAVTSTWDKEEKDITVGLEEYYTEDSRYGEEQA